MSMDGVWLIDVLHHISLKITLNKLQEIVFLVFRILKGTRILTQQLFKYLTIKQHHFTTWNL